MTWLLASAVLIATAVEAAPPLPKNQFVKVNQVKLHYLNWGGGAGETLVFLTSLGGAAGDFHPLTASLASQYRVLGLTRRGQDLSEHPDSGYDTASLAADILSFLHALQISRATLIGYSLAGNEMTEFTTHHPDRVSGLVYLDAAYDLAENTELGRKAKLNLPPLKGASKAMLALIEKSNEYHPDYSGIQAPALGIFVTYDQPPQSPMWDAATKQKLLAWWNDYGRDYRSDQIRRFRMQMRTGRVVELHDTTHGGFVFEPKQQAILLREIRSFLASHK